MINPKWRLKTDLRRLLPLTEAFHDPVHGHLPVSEFYKNLTPERFMRQKREMIEITLRELQPDFLTVANEPDTSAMNTSLNRVSYSGESEIDGSGYTQFFSLTLISSLFYTSFDRTKKGIHFK